MNAVASEAPKVVTMSFEEFEEKFRPIKNPLDENASYDGSMFETYGAELEYVKAAPQAKVWTICDSDDVVTLSEGMVHVNRAGYLITEVPAEEGVSYDILIDDFSDNDEE
jgi:hypothetical protein